MKGQTSGVYRVWALQALFVLSYCLIVGWRWQEELESALAGSLTGLLPALYVAWRLNTQPQHQDAERWMATVYRVEVNKWIMTIGLFALVFTSVQEVDPVILFGGYLVSQMAYWFAPVLVKS